MMRTSISIPTQLYQRVILTAKAEDKNMVQMIRDLLEEALAMKEKDHITQSYQALEKMVGICTDDVTDTASTINETLYGEQGAWRGKHEE